MAAVFLTKSELMQAELRHYWKLMSEAWERFLDDPLDPVIDDIVDELELLRDYTEWATLRDRCIRALALEVKLRQPLVLAATMQTAAI